jgi:hypothetical protein
MNTLLSAKVECEGGSPAVSAMLTDLSQELANCYQHAAECAERAGSCADPDVRTFYLEREEAWLLLARSCERSERAGQRLGEPKSKSVHGWPAIARVRNCPSCKVETTIRCFGLVICPNCQRIVDQVVHDAQEKAPEG